MMTDEQKASLKEQAKKEGVTPSYRHTGSSETEERTSASKAERSVAKPTFLL